MVESFSYESPNPDKYLRGIIKLLQAQGEKEIADLLKGCECSIFNTNQFSHRRWDELNAIIHLMVPISKLERFSGPILEKLRDVFDTVMPKEAGFAVLRIEVSPLLEDIPEDQSLSEDLNQILGELSQKSLITLPIDIQDKGKEMAEAYLYLYCIENSLRLFIENVAKSNFTSNWFGQLQLNRTIKENIQQRKELERRNAWLSVRGSSELFYVDFKDLGSIISLNWAMFKPYFPDLNWITSKIEELAQCRNLIAHNSYIEDHEKDVIRLYYRSILKQIGAIK